MATELVMLHDIHPTQADVIQAVKPLLPNGRLVEWRGGQILTVTDGDDNAILNIFPPRVLETGADARRLIADPPAAFALWTDVTIPYNGDPVRGRTAAKAIADAVLGSVHERI